MNEGKKGFRAKKHRVASTEPSKPRNFVAKNAKMGGAGAHKDKKKAIKFGDTKHKKDYVEHLQSQLEIEMLVERQINETGLDPLRRMKAIQYIAQKTGWGISDLELASDEELMHLYVQVKKGGAGDATDSFVDQVSVQQDEHIDDGDYNPEYDDEAGMTYNSLGTIARATAGLARTVKKGDNLPEWCQEKISLAEDYLVTVWDYLQSEKGMEESLRTDNPCWKGYKPVGTKKKNGKTVPNCVPKEGVEESGYYNPDRDAEQAWDAGRRAEQDFRNRERNAGVERETDQPYEIGRTYFKIPYDQAKEIKSMYGLRWDPEKKLWYKPKYNKSGRTHDFHIQQLEKQFPIVKMDEAANAAQQAAIAINMKKHHKKPKSEGVDEGISLDALAKFANIIPNFVDKLVHVTGQEAKETWQMLQIFKLKLQGKATPQQIQWMNEQWKDVAKLAIGAAMVGYGTAAAAAAHGASAAVGHGAKDALMHSLGDIGLETAAEVLAAKFGIDIIKKLTHGLTTSSGREHEHDQSQAPQQYGVSPAVAAKNQQDLEKMYQKARSGFGGMSEGSSGAKYKVKSIGKDSKGDYYISPNTGKKVYKQAKVGDHETPSGEIKPKVSEGAKVDRQAKHITKSMMKSHPGMSKDEAEGIAWAHIKHPKKKKKKASEGWTTDTLAAQLFEQELTYEDQLNSKLAKELKK